MHLMISCFFLVTDYIAEKAFLFCPTYDKHSSCMAETIESVMIAELQAENEALKTQITQLQAVLAKQNHMLAKCQSASLKGGTLISRQDANQNDTKALSVPPAESICIYFTNFPSGVQVHDFEQDVFKEFMQDIKSIVLIHKKGRNRRKKTIRYGLVHLLSGTTSKSSKVLAEMFIQRYNGVTCCGHEEALEVKLATKAPNTSTTIVTSGAQLSNRNETPCPSQDVTDGSAMTKRSTTSVSSACGSTDGTECQSPAVLLVQDLARNGKRYVSMRDIGRAELNTRRISAIRGHFKQFYFEHIFLYDAEEMSELEKTDTCVPKRLENEFGTDATTSAAPKKPILSTYVSVKEIHDIESEHSRRNSLTTQSGRTSIMKKKNIAAFREAVTELCNGPKSADFDFLCDSDADEDGTGGSSDIGVHIKTFCGRAAIPLQSNLRSMEAHQSVVNTKEKPEPLEHEVEAEENRSKKAVVARVKPSVELLPLEQIVNSSKYRCFQGVIVRIDYSKTTVEMENPSPILTVRGFEVPME